jgi:putative PIN family toxin of toxin-antitoxin system
VKVVIDTNIWISFLLGKSFGDLFGLLEKNKIQVLSSHRQMEELLSVIDRPKFKRHFDLADEDFLLHFLERETQNTEIKKQYDACRDKKDNFILDIAVNGGADIIVTGDKDLLALNPFEGIEIVTFQEFAKKL